MKKNWVEFPKQHGRDPDLMLSDPAQTLGDFANNSNNSKSLTKTVLRDYKNQISFKKCCISFKATAQDTKINMSKLIWHISLCHSLQSSSLLINSLSWFKWRWVLEGMGTSSTTIFRHQRSETFAHNVLEWNFLQRFFTQVKIW